MAEDLHASVADMQWVVTGYLLTLSSLIVIGGSLGDLKGRRRVFVIGLAAFAISSAVSGLAPDATALIVARVAQGVAAALVVPASLALISANFAPGDRGAAIGAWSGLGGIASAIGPFLGGWLIGINWRLVFFINVPVCALAILLAVRHVPETLDHNADPHLDILGGTTLALGLAGAVYALIEGPATGWSATSVVLGVAGVVVLGAFVVVELRSPHPMVPLHLFRSHQFSGANGTTLFVYAALGSTMFLLVVHLQVDLGYSALEAGASLLPVTVLMLLFSSRSGAIAQRIGPRLPMTVGPIVAGVGVMLFARVTPGSSYVGAVLPGAIVLGMGLVMTVAPLTATVLAAVDDDHAGIGSAVNNAVARLGGLLAVAVLPGLVGLTGAGGQLSLDAGFAKAMVVSGALAMVGGVVAFATVRRVVPVEPVTLGSVQASCLDPCVRDEAAA
jgi:EmrB/QacA subfamily drug resistance transporter